VRHSDAFPADPHLIAGHKHVTVTSFKGTPCCRERSDKCFQVFYGILLQTP
jgi:hypothetical protein